MSAEIFINPGSGPVNPGSRDQSELNIQALIKDLNTLMGIEGEVTYRFLREEDDGRHVYTLVCAGREVEVEMPPNPLEAVRWMDEPDQNIWHFPRLYVDGSSWVWKYALKECASMLKS